MVEKAMSLRLVKYGIVGLIPLLANLMTFTLLSMTGISVPFAASSAFFVGGQVAFWCHDRLTFGDRHVSLHGWFRRWRRFMPGQFVGYGMNSAAANVLAEFTDIQSGFIWLLATIAGVVGTFSWTNWFSHRVIEPPRPVDQPREHAQN